MTTGRINQVATEGRQNWLAAVSRGVGEACTTSAMPEGSPGGVPEGQLCFSVGENRRGG